MASHTIPKAAEKLRLPEGQFRRAVKLGQVKTIDFAGLQRVPDAEIERIAELLGLSISEPVEPVAKPARLEKSAPKAKLTSKPKPARKSARSTPRENVHA